MEGCRNFTPEKIDELVKKEKGGHLSEVDVKYPEELHENHNELPLFKDRIKIGRVEKLLPDLKDKKGYVVHIKALDLPLRDGLRLKKLHRVIEFQQSRWMKACIMLNSGLMKDAKNEFEKDFSKLMNNSVFGKTMENIRSHNDMKTLVLIQHHFKRIL